MTNMQCLPVIIVISALFVAKLRACTNVCVQYFPGDPNALQNCNYWCTQAQWQYFFCQYLPPGQSAFANYCKEQIWYNLWKNTNLLCVQCGKTNSIYGSCLLQEFNAILPNVTLGSGAVDASRLLGFVGTSVAADIRITRAGQGLFSWPRLYNTTVCQTG